MIRLIPESKNEFKKQKINIKLRRRFWMTINMYNDGFDYKHVMNEFIWIKTKETINNHRKIECF